MAPDPVSLSWLSGTLDVSRETLVGLETLASLLVEENRIQNLIAPATVDSLWWRHIIDSAQLVPLAPPEGLWVDIGAGAGFPGLVVAMLRRAPMMLIEPRRLRAQWLARAVARLSLDHVEVIAAHAERVQGRPAATISARAVASLGRLFAIGEQFSTEETVWLLPKGRGASEELETTRRSWHGDFAMVSSATDPDSRIVIARNVRRRARA